MLRLELTAAVEGRPALHAARPRSAARTASPPDLTRSTCASGRGPARDFDIQVGRVPPTFGAFRAGPTRATTRSSAIRSAYQYLTSLRPDALPASADELLRMRARGWLSNYSVGNLAPDRGVPLVSAFRWDTGVQVHAGNGIVDATASVTAGTLSNPLFSDDNGGRQSPDASAVIRSRAGRRRLARARPFVSRAASGGASARTARGEFTQTAWGGDVEYSRDYYLVRAEAVVSDWRLPVLRSAGDREPVARRRDLRRRPLQDAAGALRRGAVDHLGFSEIAGTSTTRPGTRRSPVRGRRRLLDPAQSAAEGRVSAQPRGGRSRPRAQPRAAQLVFWF